MSQHPAAAAPPDIDDIRAAAKRIAPYAVRTPLLESPRLNDRLGFRLLVKPECLQRTGAFKLRGACNTIMGLDDAVGDVVAYSSGNHAQAVAYAARLRGIRAHIIMPDDAPKMKIEGTKSYGAQVIMYDRYAQSREEIGEALASEHGAELVRPYDDARVIAGQGTVGLEIAAQCAEIGATPEHVVCCCGGGGLIAGTSIALKADMPGAKIWAAEPEGFDDTVRSLKSGNIESVDGDARSICDAIVTPRPGDITFSVNRNTLSGGFAVSDDTVLRAMASAFAYLKLVCEPGGTVAFAAVLDGCLPKDTECAVAVITGGNVDAEMFTRALGLGPLV